MARAGETSPRPAAIEAARAKAERDAERDAWITAHGSQRLLNGLVAGLVDRMAGAYRSERLTHDLGAEWMSWDAEDADSERLNPSEAEIDALLALRAKWPDTDLEVQLRSVRESGDDDQEAGPWRPALMMRMPWERDRFAVRYLDCK